jgi:hypothetical protein
MTIADIVVGSFLVIGPVALVIAHRSGRLSEWWGYSRRSSCRGPRL